MNRTFSSILIISLSVASFGCGGGGGGGNGGGGTPPPPPASKTFRAELTEIKVVDAATAEDLSLTGLSNQGATVTLE